MSGGEYYIDDEFNDLNDLNDFDEDNKSEIKHLFDTIIDKLDTIKSQKNVRKNIEIVKQDIQRVYDTVMDYIETRLEQ